MYSIRTRLIVGLSLLLGFLLMQAAITRYYANGNEQLVTSAIDRDFTASNETALIVAEAQKIRRFEKEYLIYLTDPAKRGKYYNEWSESFGKLGQMIGAIVANQRGHWSGREIEAARQWQMGLAGYGQGFAAVIAAVEAGQLRDTREGNDAIQPAKNRFAVVLDGASEVAQAKYQSAQAANRQVKSNFSLLNWVLGGFALLGLALCGAMVMLLPGAIARPVESLAAAAEEISTGNLSRPIQGVGATEFRKLAETLERMRVSQKMLIDRLKSGLMQRAS